MKKEAPLIYFSEKKLLNDIRKIKNTTIYVMKDFEKNLLVLGCASYRSLMDIVKKNNIEIKILNLKIKNKA